METEQHIVFPDPFTADEDGFLAYGGNLAPETLISAYSNGIFPWFSEDSPVLWYAPNPRFVIFPEKIKIHKSMRQILRNTPWEIKINHQFGSVIQYCAKIKRAGQEGTWITNDMMNAYTDLHGLQYAHSIEVYLHDELVGGLYGILINRVFCGESMFSLTPNASKVALIFLAQQMNLKLIDCQFHTDHLESMGGEYIPLQDYLAILNEKKA